MEIGNFMSFTISALHVNSIRALSKVAVNILYKQFDFRIVNFTTSAILQYRCPFSVDY